MNLSDIARKIMNEDTWGNNPSAAGGMSPGRTPTTVSPGLAARSLDISNLYKNFKSRLEKQEDASINKLVSDLKKNFLKKNVRVKASKGGVGQIEKEYNINVSNIDIRYMKDKYYIVFSGREGKQTQPSEYYLDDSVIQVTDAAPSISSTGKTGGMAPAPVTSMPKKNILPQG